MIAFAKPPIIENETDRWYVLIVRAPEGVYRWDCVVEDNYDEYQRRIIIELDHEIMAGPYSVEEKVLDRITGCNSQGQEIGHKYLEELVRRMNFKDKINVEYELEKLIRGDLD